MKKEHESAISLMMLWGVEKFLSFVANVVDPQVWINDMAEAIRGIEYTDKGREIIEELIETARKQGLDISKLRDAIYDQVDDGMSSLFSNSYKRKECKNGTE
jgi:hypothetical protein